MNEEKTKIEKFRNKKIEDKVRNQIKRKIRGVIAFYRELSEYDLGPSTGDMLDMWARTLGVQRYESESDEHLRKRILEGLR